MPVSFCGQCNGPKYGEEIDHCDCKYYSIVLWPDEVCLGKTPNESRDTHGSRRAAEFACGKLEEVGLGGEGKIFPISTRVEKVPS